MVRWLAFFLTAVVATMAYPQVSSAQQDPVSAILQTFFPDLNFEAGDSRGQAIPRAIVSYRTREQPGTIVVDSPARRLYLVLEGGKALRYGIGVGRPGFEWGGVKTITRKAEWPDWRPPAEMLRRRPDLPRFMKGGLKNPLGARALYLGSSLYRIHGSNEPHAIGMAVSSGCIRMTNADVKHLYDRVRVGTKVVIIRG